MRALSGNEEKLRARLNEEEKILLEKLVDAQGGLIRLTAVGNLICGYKPGLITTAEAFIGMGDLVIGGE